MKGRTPIPDALKEAQGTLKKSRVNDSQAKFAVPANQPKPPMTLNLYGKRLWKQMLPKLIETGLYSEGDYNALELLCMAYGDLIEARKDLKVSGTIVETDKGTVYQHPNVGISNQAWVRVKMMLGQFGLTPAERTRVKALSPAEKGKSLADSLFAAARQKVEDSTSTQTTPSDQLMGTASYDVMGDACVAATTEKKVESPSSSQPTPSSPAARPFPQGGR